MFLTNSISSSNQQLPPNQNWPYGDTQRSNRTSVPCLVQVLKNSVRSKHCCVVPHVSHLFAQCTVSCCWCLKSAFLCLFWVAHGSSCHLCFLAASICHFCFLISFEVYLRPELWTMTSQNGGRVKDLKHPGPSASRTQPRFRHQC